MQLYLSTLFNYQKIISINIKFISKLITYKSKYIYKEYFIQDNKINK